MIGDAYVLGSTADETGVQSVQASEAEMLLDDARRYVYKACASGSPARLQTWAGMLHIWQIFDPQLPQAREAWVEIGKFFNDHAVS